VIFTFLQFVLFSVAYVAGTILPPFGLLPSHVSTWAGGTRFEWDGVFMTLALFLLILVIEALRKRLRTAAPWTMLALALRRDRRAFRQAGRHDSLPLDMTNL